MEIIHLSRKSSILNFSRKRSTIPPLLKICDKPIPEVKSLKILGIIFDPNITWKNHINYLRQKGFKYLNAIKALSSPKIGTRSDHLLNIINATIRSIFDYGSQLFSFSSNSNRQKLEPIYNAALRLALGLPRNTPLDLLRAEYLNGNINSRHNFLCQKFITKQIALKDWSPNASYLRTITTKPTLRLLFDNSSVAAAAEWYRYRTVACFVTGSSPVPLKTRRVGQRCTLNLPRAETSSRWCGVVVTRGGVPAQVSSTSLDHGSK
ncbi:putative RNA-directed DNA polymerase from transposon BS [Trichonephila clavipes]|nr:putative RNA-directed DNA polymerase from transposon BS [Trichonephila clavipes]